MLIGAETFFQLLCIGQIQTANSRTILQKTLFGWIVAGRVEHAREQAPASPRRITMMSTEAAPNDLSQLLRRFWELEEVTNIPVQSNTGTRSEEFYMGTVRRDPDGRYVVHLPVDHAKLKQIGETRNRAVQRFLSLEGRLERDKKQKQAYVQFMNEYIALGHMQLATGPTTPELPEVFLPHHGVQRTESSTTKLRVVFDGSAKSTTGVALNDALMVGPTIQDDLFSIITRFRMHRYAMTGDLEKMYRQIRVTESHTQLQKIVWRNDSNEPLQDFTLNTVTYGTSAAPYLATRTLLQLANDEASNFPRAASVLRKDFYVDDLLTGTDDLAEAQELQTELIDLCQRGGFKLRKWCANDVKLIEQLPVETRGTTQELNAADHQSTKTLGVHWNPRSDEIHYSIKHPDSHPTCTKRTVVSEMTQLFDPLGLIGPVVIRAKMFVQMLWRLQLDWDESLPLVHQSSWMKYRQELLALNHVLIPRKVISSHPFSDCQLHVFCDASERAYGACVYSRSTDQNQVTSSQLVCSKSRIAPLKSITIPRLELCAALLVAQLACKVIKASNSKFTKHVMWSDSTIVLAWLKEPGGSRQWKQFVANRVSEIHALTGDYEWRHVRSQDNPADHLSRGVTPTELIQCSQWWHGPTWLIQTRDHWPPGLVKPDTQSVPERRAHELYTLTARVSPTMDELTKNHSKLERLQRVIAWCFRFMKNIPNRRKGNAQAQATNEPSPLTANELNQALTALIRHSQNKTFATEINELATQEHVSAQSKIRSLNPFIDATGIIRVGGRLYQARIDYGMRHPIILRATDTLTQLIIEMEHRRLLHAGPQQLQASLRQRYWIIGARDATRRQVHNCATCHRWKAEAAKQLMGSLPSARANPSTAFTICGVDYGGPFPLRHGHARSKAATKAYVALFICFSTRAIHLELVSDLTTDAFLAAFRRFIARRGKPKEINSDNGTTFVGANRLLGEFIRSQTNQDHIVTQTAPEGITWKCIPPHAPHFGGLWEAGIKATKYHLKCIVGETILSFEELCTILAQIEAILNSRPLFALTNDPIDLEVLTPAHFLIGRPLTAFPEPNYTDERCLRKRWHMLQQIVQHFWRRWHHEYLLLLQQRPKWSTQQKNLQPGDLVLIKEDNQAPLTWSKGQIIELHPGADNLSRVATIKTARGLMRRSIHKLSLLPNQQTGSKPD